MIQDELVYILRFLSISGTLWSIQHISVHLARHEIFELVADQCLNLIFVVPFRSRKKAQRCPITADTTHAATERLRMVARPDAEFFPVLLSHCGVVARQGPNALFEVFVLIWIRCLDDGQQRLLIFKRLYQFILHVRNLFSVIRRERSPRTHVTQLGGHFQRRKAQRIGKKHKLPTSFEITRLTTRIDVVH